MSDNVGQDVKDSIGAPFRKFSDTLGKFMGEDKPLIPKKVDTKYQSDMLKAANDSFRKAAQDPKLGQTKKKVRARTSPGKASQKRSY